MLLRSGSAALAWRSVRNSDLRDSAPARQLREAHDLHSLQALAHEDDIRTVIRIFRANGLDPILVKGWASARLYDDPGLRPYGDIDLCVHPDEYTKANTLLKEHALGHLVDLHSGLDKFREADWEGWHSRSEGHQLDGVSVRTPALEDHLRLLSFHFLREGGWRPLWLVDVAVAVEKRSANFDWEACLGSDRKRRQRTLCSLVLAHKLLDMRLENDLLREASKNSPTWLLPAVLKQWEVRSAYERHKFPMARIWRRSFKDLRGIRHHWPTPVEATIALNGSFDESPRFGFQIAAAGLRTIRFLLRLRLPPSR